MIEISKKALKNTTFFILKLVTTLFVNETSTTKKSLMFISKTNFTALTVKNVNLKCS